MQKDKFPSPFGFRVFLLAKVPAAFFAGLRLKKISSEEASVTVSYNWFNQNPFKSIYFAVLSMAAEATTGILCISVQQKETRKISMLIIKNEGFFYKKAKGIIVFTCCNGKEIKAAMETAKSKGEATAVTCNSKGLDEAGDVVAEFNFIWSFKPKQMRK